MNSMKSWYSSFNQWVDLGECYVLRSGIQAMDKTIESDKFYTCL